ncbi:MAG TPA: hypothetical protein VFS56_06275, partial [Gemmatimonadaceae bacterium]|nr:hypothetical protein [Gemmatimonadaceae bacterium]
PHELTEGHLRDVTDWARANDLALSRVSSAGHAAADVLLVDRYGVLGDLYALADVAYVGGGFHAAGLHSVLEPAAFGAPVLFGPTHRKSREAVALLRCGGARVVSGGDDLARRLIELLSSEELRGSSGAAARGMVKSGLGAAERSYQLVTELLGR